MGYGVDKSTQSLFKVDKYIKNWTKKNYRKYVEEVFLNQVWILYNYGYVYLPFYLLVIPSVILCGCGGCVGGLIGVWKPGGGLCVWAGQPVSAITNTSKSNQKYYCISTSYSSNWYINH